MFTVTIQIVTAEVQEWFAIDSQGELTTNHGPEQKEFDDIVGAAKAAEQAIRVSKFTLDDVEEIRVSRLTWKR